MTLTATHSGSNWIGLRVNVDVIASGERGIRAPLRGDDWKTGMLALKGGEVCGGVSASAARFVDKIWIRQ